MSRKPNRSSETVRNQNPKAEGLADKRMCARLLVPNPRSYVAMGAHDRTEKLGPDGVTVATIAHVVTYSGELNYTGSVGDIIRVGYAGMREHIAGGKQSTVCGDQTVQVGNTLKLTAGGIVHSTSKYNPDSSQDRSPPVPPDPYGDDARKVAGRLKTGFDLIWKPYDAVAGFRSFNKAWAPVHEDRERPRAASIKAHKRQWDLLKNGLKAPESSWGALHAALLAFGGSAEGSPSIPKLEPDHSGKVDLCASNSTSIKSGFKTAIFSGYSSTMEALYKVSIKSWWTASLKAFGDTTVFGGLAAKLESKGIAAVVGAFTSIKGGHVAIQAESDGGAGTVKIDSNGPMSLKAEKSCEISSDEGVLMEGRHAEISAADSIAVHVANGPAIALSNQPLSGDRWHSSLPGVAIVSGPAVDGGTKVLLTDDRAVVAAVDASESSGSALIVSKAFIAISQRSCRISVGKGRTEIRSNRVDIC